MRRLVYFIASTLDGFITDPEGSDPTGPGGFWPVGEDYVGHLVSEYPETLPGLARDAMGITGEGRHFDTALEGRRSYEIGLKAGLSDAYPHLRHVVFSSSLVSPDPAVTVIAGDPAAAVRELKAESSDRDIWLVGGGDVAGALYSEIDRLVVKLAPLTIGAGIPVFGRQAAFAPHAWALADHTVLPSGTIFLTYDRVQD
ncbi:deaminase [Aeromicrobium flavum]|uniref:Deaminase n=1 Tax=Aeromicrobium flavum TaxID=416568 RepID=A0A512HUI5_9ACTN|nr:dihydrofolate reductase family protein [Aeromicrobium flavum]GEO89113.1 deaminase [Aeromicrobium flavum]